MEKRRRARINASLTELKSFLLDMIKKEVSLYFRYHQNSLSFFKLFFLINDGIYKAVNICNNKKKIKMQH